MTVMDAYLFVALVASLSLLLVPSRRPIRVRRRPEVVTSLALVRAFRKGTR
jgi:hypothetical protein